MPTATHVAIATQRGCNWDNMAIDALVQADTVQEEEFRGGEKGGGCTAAKAFINSVPKTYHISRSARMRTNRLENVIGRLFR